MDSDEEEPERSINAVTQTTSGYWFVVVFLYKKPHMSPVLRKETPHVPRSPQGLQYGVNLISEKERCHLYVIYHPYRIQIIIVRNICMITDPDIQIGQGQKVGFGSLFR